MFLCGVTKPQRRFVARIWTASGLCVLFCIVASLVFRFLHPHGLPAYMVALLPALAIIGQLLAIATYITEETDEFQRAMLVQCLLGGLGGMLAAVTTWGYLEDFAHVPHLDLVWVYPIFWLFAGLSYPVVRARYR